jgi:FMN phosphatase YigB (HAD superfamily)
MSKYTTIFFDWNKTLSHSRFWQQWEDDTHLYHVHHQQIIITLFVHNKQKVAEWMRGQISTDEIIKMLALACDIPADIIMNGLRESCQSMKFAYPELLDDLRKLRKLGARCVIATDNMDTFRRWTISGMKLEDIFDDFLISAELDVMKFDNCANGKIPFFDNYLREHGITRNEVALIDDCIDDGYFAQNGFDILQVGRIEDLREVVQDLLELALKR